MSSSDLTQELELKFHFIVPVRLIYDTMLNPM